MARLVPAGTKSKRPLPKSARYKRAFIMTLIVALVEAAMLISMLKY